MKRAISTIVTGSILLLTGPAIWAQKYPKRAAGSGAEGPAHPPVSLHIRSLKGRPAGLAPHAVIPAAGAAMCHLDANGSLSGLFINTATIPSGSTITGGITLLDDNSSINFTGETLSQALSPGSVVFLPNIPSFGDLWNANGAAIDISVQIQPPVGAASQVDCQVLVGEAYANADLVNNEPLIGTVSQTIASNKDLKMVLSGYFTGDTPLVVLADQYSIYLVPASAVTLVSASEIDVDLSQIQGLDLTSSDILFVSVSQAGFTDTVEYRYLPGTPGSFNPTAQ
jgi:hypothetical protein